MKDILNDIIHHTLPLGGIELIKIVGTANETSLSAVTENKTVILNARFKTPIPQFSGVFGMPSLEKLRTILSFDDEYDGDAKISVVSEKKDGEDHPSVIHFENKSGDFVNDYRLMGKTLVEQKIKNVIFKGAAWNLNFKPTIPGITRLKKQSSVHNDEPNFNGFYENNALVMSFGNVSTHAGKFIFQTGVSGSLTKSFHWPVKQFLSIMDLVGDKHIYISDQGVMRVTLDSGIAEYEYLLPVQKQ
jgi:hypothetical protein